MNRSSSQKTYFDFIGANAVWICAFGLGLFPRGIAAVIGLFSQLAQWSPGELIGLVAVLLAAAVAAITLFFWHRVRLAQAQANLKLSMLQRGLTPDEIERLLSGPSSTPMDQSWSYRKVARVICVSVALLYVAACICPACIFQNHVTFQGYQALWYGGIFGLLPGTLAVGDLLQGHTDAALAYISYLSWWANPLGLVGVLLLLLRVPTVAAVFGLASVLLGALYLLAPPCDAHVPQVPLFGAYLWVLSFAVLAVGAIATGLIAGKQQGTPPISRKAKKDIVDIQAEQSAPADSPREHGASSHNVKPA